MGWRGEGFDIWAGEEKGLIFGLERRRVCGTLTDVECVLFCGDPNPDEFVTWAVLHHKCTKIGRRSEQDIRCQSVCLTLLLSIPNIKEVKGQQRETKWRRWMVGKY